MTIRTLRGRVRERLEPVAHASVSFFWILLAAALAIALDPGIAVLAVILGALVISAITARREKRLSTTLSLATTREKLIPIEKHAGYDGGGTGLADQIRAITAIANCIEFMKHAANAGRLAYIKPIVGVAIKSLGLVQRTTRFVPNATPARVERHSTRTVETFMTLRTPPYAYRTYNASTPP